MENLTTDSVHIVHAMKDRVSGNHLPDNHPLCDVSKLPLSTWLPSILRLYHSKGGTYSTVRRVYEKMFHCIHFLGG